MTEFFGRKGNGDEIEITEMRPWKNRPMLSLLRFRDLYVVVDRYGQLGEPEDDWYDYLFHSHQCTANIMKSVREVFCPRDGNDPHGLFRFIAAIDNNDANYKALREETNTLAHLFRLFNTDGTEAPTRWPENERGLLPGLARLWCVHSQEGN